MALAAGLPNARSAHAKSEASIDTPSNREANVWTDMVRCDQPVVTGIAIDFEHARDVLRNRFGVSAATTKRIVNRTWMIR